MAHDDKCSYCDGPVGFIPIGCTHHSWIICVSNLRERIAEIEAENQRLRAELTEYKCPLDGEPFCGVNTCYECMRKAYFDAEAETDEAEQQLTIAREALEQLISAATPMRYWDGLMQGALGALYAAIDNANEALEKLKAHEDESQRHESPD